MSTSANNVAQWLDIIPLMACACDQSGRVLESNTLWSSSHQPDDATHLLSTDDQPKLLKTIGTLWGAPDRRTVRMSFMTRLGSGKHQSVPWTLTWDPASARVICSIHHETSHADEAGSATSQQLADANDILTAVLDNLPLSVFVKDVPSGFKFVAWNRQCEQVSKVPASWAIGRTDFDVFPEAFARQTRERDEATIKQGFAFETPALHYNPSTGERIFHQVKVPVFDREGNARLIVGISNDITEIKKAEAEIDTLSSMIHTSHDIFLYCTLDGRVLFMNQGSILNFGWTSYQNHLADLMAPESHTRMFGSVIPDLADGSKQWQGELELISRTSGDPFPVWANLFTVKTSSNQAEVLCFIGSDLTARREQDSLLANASKLAALGEMAGGIAHEINNPLSIVLGKTKILKDMISSNTLTPERLITDIEKIESTARRISNIVNGLRTLSRTADRDQLEPTSLKNLITETLDLCQHRFRNHDVALVVKPFSDATLHCRPAQVVQVIVNLLNNAFDSVQELTDKWVRIEIVSVGGQIEIAVMDSGKGIAPEVVGKLMQPFFSTKPKGKGTGLGLSISRRIAEQHGGTLVYDGSCPNTRFVLSLPDSNAIPTAA